MFSAILKILASKETVCDTIHVSQEEFFMIKEFFDDAIHLIYAQEKNHSRDGDLKKNEAWQNVYALAKGHLIRCNEMMVISESRDYVANQMHSEPVYVIHKEMVEILKHLSFRLNSIYGLADGTEIATILTELRNRNIELTKKVTTITTPVTPKPEDGFYHLES